MGTVEITDSEQYLHGWTEQASPRDRILCLAERSSNRASGRIDLTLRHAELRKAGLGVAAMLVRSLEGCLRVGELTAYAVQFAFQVIARRRSSPG